MCERRAWPSVPSWRLPSSCTTSSPRSVFSVSQCDAFAAFPGQRQQGCGAPGGVVLTVAQWSTEDADLLRLAAAGSARLHAADSMPPTGG